MIIRRNNNNIMQMFRRRRTTRRITMKSSTSSILPTRIKGRFSFPITAGRVFLGIPQKIIFILFSLMVLNNNGGIIIRNNNSNNSNSFFVDAALSCTTTVECETQLRKGSECVNGSCSNPFVKGCIRTMLESGDYFKYHPVTINHTDGEEGKEEEAITEAELIAIEERIKSSIIGHNGRVCNSDDIRFNNTLSSSSSSLLEDNNNGNSNSNSNSNNDDDSSSCSENTLEYPEVRIHGSNWESSIFSAWIMQIVSMEILKVPVSVGLNSGNTNVSSFYSTQNTLEYSSATYPWDAIPVINDDGDENDDEDNAIDGVFNTCDQTMEDCIQVMPEVWESQDKTWQQNNQDGIIDPVDSFGLFGGLSWYIPLFTARRIPSLVSYFGMQGEKHRPLLAQTFKRPTSWQEYCQRISTSNCTIPDAVSGRYPIMEDGEGVKYFEQGLYTGYFEATEETNCTKYPTSCTGYIVQPPCTWSTYVDSQVYWNDIGLTMDGPLGNGGYSYGQMIDVWQAANATQSDVIMWWWYPDALIEEFSGTDSSFQQVLLPAATDECFDNRPSPDDLCSENITVRRGNPLGSCEQEASALKKIIASSLAKQNSFQPNDALKSPGYDFIRSFEISDEQMQSLLKRWKTPKMDTYGNDAREAVCSYVVENIEQLLSFVPYGFPKTVDETISSYKEGYLYVATMFAIVCAAMIVITTCVVYKWRKTEVFVYAQEKFVQIIMLGFLLVCVGALLYSLKPTRGNCTARIWFVTLGYNTELAAVLVKISAINRVMQSSDKLKRIRITRRAMLGTVAALVTLATCYLIMWTVVSPPIVVTNFVLQDEYSETIEISLMCQSEQAVWPYLALGWQTLLLLVASVLAFQSKDIIPEFNESQSFGTMIYSHFLFVVLRIIVGLIGVKEILQPNVVSACESFLLSFDVLLATVIYVIPKCYEARKYPEQFDSIQRTTTLVSNNSFRFDPAAASPGSRRGSFTTSGGMSSRRASFTSSGGMSSRRGSFTTSGGTGMSSRRASFTSSGRFGGDGSSSGGYSPNFSPGGPQQALSPHRSPNVRPPRGIKFNSGKSKNNRPRESSNSVRLSGCEVLPPRKMLPIPPFDDSNNTNLNYDYDYDDDDDEDNNNNSSSSSSNNVGGGDDADNVNGNNNNDANNDVSNSCHSSSHNDVGGVDPSSLMIEEEETTTGSEHNKDDVVTPLYYKKFDPSFVEKSSSNTGEMSEEFDCDPHRN